MIEQAAKEKLIKEFRMMQEFEASARDFYLKADADPVVRGGEVGAEFARAALHYCLPWAIASSF